MTELLTAAQMRAIETAAIDSGAVTGLDLVEQAGRGVVEAIFEAWPALRATTHRAVVLCGPGNNGGDGFVVARLLKDWGWEVAVFLLGDPARLPPDARVTHGRWAAMGEVSPLDDYPDDDRHVDLCVDALFGTGLGRPVDGVPGQILARYSASARHNGRLVCIDIPSGLCSDSGRVLGGFDRPNAALTVTFHRAKPGHYLAEGPFHSGRIAVADIGLPTTWRDTPAMKRSEVLHLEDIPTGNDRHRLSKARVPAAPHKYTHGHAVILAGGPGKGGAARLAARGALRIGAGLVTVACPPAALQENAARLDAIMLRPVRDAAALSDLLADQRLNAICLGPGLGVGPDTRAVAAAALGHAPGSTSGPAAPERPGPALGGGAVLSSTPAPFRGVILDADALTAFADDPAALFALLHSGCVLTPHAGEFARLFPDIADRLNAPTARGPAYSKVDATREAAARAGCTVLFKGPDTVIADQTGAARVNAAAYDRAAPWLATAGAGDVLAGMIAGLRARGFAPLDAAATAAWLHVEAARIIGPGLIAEDLPEALPRVFRDLGL